MPVLAHAHALLAARDVAPPSPALRHLAADLSLPEPHLRAQPLLGHVLPPLSKELRAVLLPDQTLLAQQPQVPPILLLARALVLAQPQRLLL